MNEAPQDQIKLLHSSLSSSEDQWSGAVTLSLDLPTVCPHAVRHTALIMSQDSLTIVQMQRLQPGQYSRSVTLCLGSRF